jgi:hypothetical protein
MEREPTGRNPKQLAFYQMKKESVLKMLRSLLTIYHVTTATISIHQIVSIDMDLVITPAQAQVHWHCELNKKFTSH